MFDRFAKKYNFNKPVNSCFWAAAKAYQKRGNRPQSASCFLMTRFW